ncbi:MAG: NADPH-dependent oxidoreductase [Methanobacteriota archaeon]|nr:MAG: NADPH-dependent oxidoreductase [Euryarchaeota archaeon]
MPKIVLIQSSLNPRSRTAIVLEETRKKLVERGTEAEILDLRDYDIPFCDGRSLDEYPESVQRIRPILESADAFIIGFPVYMYTFSGVVKNFLDIFSSYFERKICGIVMNAGGSNCYLASRDLINSMNFEVGTVFVQPTVYSYSSHFDETKTRLESEYVLNKIDQMIDSLLNSLGQTLSISA